MLCVDRFSHQLSQPGLWERGGQRGSTTKQAVKKNPKHDRNNTGSKQEKTAQTSQESGKSRMT